MRKKMSAVALTVILCIIMSTTAFAVSSNTGSSSSSSSSSGSSSSHRGSSSSAAVTEATRGNTNTDNVKVAVPAADGTVTSVNLTQFTKSVDISMATVAANSAANGANPGEAVSAVMTTPASELFKATINVLGGKIKLVNAGGYKVAATAADPSGKTVASLGAVKGVTQYAFVVLTAVNADGSVEIVEGVVDPVSLHVMGIFNGTPVTVTVSVIQAA